MSFRDSVRFIVSTIIAGAVVLIPYTANYLIGQAQSILDSIGIQDWPLRSYKILLFIVIWLLVYFIFFLVMPRPKK